MAGETLRASMVPEAGLVLVVDKQQRTGNCTKRLFFKKKGCEQDRPSPVARGRYRRLGRRLGVMLLVVFP